VVEAVAAAREWLGKPEASVTYWRAPPIGYARVTQTPEDVAITAAADAAKEAAKAARVAAGEPPARGDFPCEWSARKAAEVAAATAAAAAAAGGGSAPPPAAG